MSERLVFDTDVLIDYLRDHEAAAVFLKGCSQPLALSVISVAELSVGVRDGEERSRLDEFIAAFETLPVDALISPSVPSGQERPSNQGGPAPIT